LKKNRKHEDYIDSNSDSKSEDSDLEDSDLDYDTTKVDEQSNNTNIKPNSTTNT